MALQNEILTWSNHHEYMQKSQGNTIHKFLQGIWFFMQTKDEANIISISSL